MNLGVLIEQFRLLADDDAQPALWSDPELIRWINEAEVEACRRARLIVDSQTTAICSLTSAISAEFIVLDPRIIYLRRAEWVGRTLPLTPYDYRDLDREESGWRTRTITSNPRGYIRNLDSGKFRPYPICTVAGTIKLTVVREPIAPMDTPEDIPEIGARYHMALLDWVFFRAYSKKDSQAFDPKLAAAHLEAFSAEFGTREKASAVEEEWQRLTLPFDDAYGSY